MVGAAALRAQSPARMFAASPSSSGAGPSTLSSETCSILSRRAPEIKVNCVCVCVFVCTYMCLYVRTHLCVFGGWGEGGVLVTCVKTRMQK